MSFQLYNVMKSHEDDSDNDDEFMHVCTIVIFLLIRLLYSLIYLINYLFQSIQFYSMLANFINLIAVSSLTAYYTQNHLFTQLSHINAHIQKQFIQRVYFFITKQQQH